ncbi:MAG: 30S ribosomal protein S2 [Candidatus Raymondbacteria bacterium RifOxyA12_full_50_37]|uniref:Small ribosomal subunit protein uS2 n=1 Tax=Candidatus Raymondbacteria bacterium RIFOXYD12_FULL_49_13 TaxID=1817890 RepID=A0A1F7FAU3_UNCRA|nr:MAG: 30S ribosomal protein S2 [Candidatus Raymondbacteria bacterium RifOxyA12_full_50_37]OGJ92388.1 MAG: 30S ribosomal protein S2 [Candidatus Raymondbacteria bacterium RIFOXYA2_FULL_49_16]OGJ98347.1 MAG: 30S ribosomal protein S2 [Candidatus Raymondbacteria bacterium RifOxyC12_full_50_8]OGJ99369.1 MAG: 30S ribosomal protein S2 [Candidatus Raymondbacteria bacterium RIFOXYC2_FULL_50_21]OGK03617.1 MAG: 30S ribosomal protein S2 [Candidatus Raymondbacteria bacterium RIFOXYD12_FULL_49_13]OGP44281.
MAEITIQSLLEAGAHFGHQTSRWNPKMRKFILAPKNGIHLINLQETINCLEAAKKKLVEVVESGQSVLFVGTKKQATDLVREAAEQCKHFYVNNRWLGGLLTNFTTIRNSLKKVDDIDRMEQDGTFGVLPKKEVNLLKKKRDKILSFLAGIREMRHLPGAVVVTDVITNHIAVKEANRLGISVIAIVDTNGDPDSVTYPIPANDDSLKTIRIIVMELAAIIAATPVKMVRAEEKADSGMGGRKRIVRKKIIKKIIRKKVLKSDLAAAAAAADAATEAMVETETEVVEEVAEAVEQQLGQEEK